LRGGDTQAEHNGGQRGFQQVSFIHETQLSCG
jgi:hypothetical protein